MKKSNRLVTAELQNKKMPHFDHFPRPGEIDPYIPPYCFTLFDFLYISLHLMSPVDTSRKIVLNKETFATCVSGLPSTLAPTETSWLCITSRFCSYCTNPSPIVNFSLGMKIKFSYPGAHPNWPAGRGIGSADREKKIARPGPSLPLIVPHSLPGNAQHCLGCALLLPVVVMCAEMYLWLCQKWIVSRKVNCMSALSLCSFSIVLEIMQRTLNWTVWSIQGIMHSSAWWRWERVVLPLKRCWGFSSQSNHFETLFPGSG